MALGALVFGSAELLWRRCSGFVAECHSGELAQLGEVNAHLVLRTDGGRTTATIHGWASDRATTVQVPPQPRTVSGWCPSCRSVYRWALDRGPRRKALCAACFGRLRAVPRNVEVEVEGRGPLFQG